MTQSVFDLQATPEHARGDAWHEVLANTFVSLDCTWTPQEPARGRIASADAGAMLISHVASVGQTVRRTRPLIRRDGAEVMLISCQLSGEGIVAQDDRSARLRPGDFAFYDSTRPYTLQFERGFDQLVLHMPRDVLRRRVASCRDLTARTFRSDMPSIAAASGFLAGLGNSFGGLDRASAQGLGRVALDLVTQAILDITGGPDAAETCSAEDTVHHRAMAAIGRHFTDPAFATPALARLSHVSCRRLQEVFAARGTAPMAAIWERRLDEAAARLADPKWRRLSLTDIALATGFADSAQFSRRFRAKFGATPSHWRRARSG